ASRTASGRWRTGRGWSPLTEGSLETCSGRSPISPARPRTQASLRPCRKRACCSPSSRSSFPVSLFPSALCCTGCEALGQKAELSIGCATRCCARKVAAAGEPFLPAAARRKGHEPRVIRARRQGESMHDREACSDRGGGG